MTHPSFSHRYLRVLPLVGKTPSSLRSFALLLAFAAASGQATALTYEWRNANSQGDGTNNGWRQTGNYGAGGAGQYTFTADDELYFNATAARNVQFGGNGVIGTLRFGPNTAANVITGSTTAGVVINLDGSTRSNAGVILEAGAGEIGLNARFNLVGNITLANNSGISASPISIGNGSNGGFEGTGNLLITGGRTSLGRGIAANYANTGTTTVNLNGTLQVGSSAIYTTSAVTIGDTGTLSGGGTLGSTTIQSGGRISVGGDGSTSAAPGVLTFTNLLTLQAGSQTVIDLKPAGADSINALAGSIALGGELRLRASTDFASSGSYNLFLGLNGSSGNFDAVTIRTGTDAATAVNLTHNGAGIWTTNYEAKGLELSFNANTGILDVTAVPEPQIGALSLIGSAALIFGRRRRNLPVSSRKQP